MSKQTEISVQGSQAVALAMSKDHGLGIQGLEDEDVSILPIPFVRVVQGQSKDVKTKEGKEAPEGSFFFNDTKEFLSELTFCIIKSKVTVTSMDDISNPGKKKDVTQRKVLGMTMDTHKLFVLTLSIGSFGQYGRLVAEMKQNKVAAVWDRIITASTEKVENDKGKFYVVNFALGEPVNEEDRIEMGLAFEQYHNLFEKQEEPEVPEGGEFPPIE